VETAGRGSSRAARFVGDAINPFSVFTVLYALVAFSGEPPLRALILLAAELSAAGLVALFVLILRRRRRVGGFWIPSRTERFVPALFLLAAFGGLLLALALLGAPQTLFDLTLSMGLAAATIAAVTLVWKASGHSAVAGHAAAASILLFGPLSLPFVLALPLVVWARVACGAHTLPQALVGATTGAAFAAAFLL
jgi:hypothetical protein